MTKAYFLMMCALFALILGVPWGAFIYWFHPAAGLIVGISLFVLCLMALVNLGNEFDRKEEKEAQHNRRFNDV
jgi:hypothetical protein